MSKDINDLIDMEIVTAMGCYYREATDQVLYDNSLNGKGHPMIIDMSHAYNALLSIKSKLESSHE